MKIGSVITFLRVIGVKKGAGAWSAIGDVRRHTVFDGTIQLNPHGRREVYRQPGVDVKVASVDFR